MFIDQEDNVSTVKVGHRFGIVFAALPAIAGLAFFVFTSGRERFGLAAIFLGLAAIIYLICLGIGWAISAIRD